MPTAPISLDNLAPGTGTVVPGTLSGTLATLHEKYPRARPRAAAAALAVATPRARPLGRPDDGGEPQRCRRSTRTGSISRRSPHVQSGCFTVRGGGGGAPRSLASRRRVVSLARGIAVIRRAVIVGVVVATVGVAVVIRRSLVAVRTAGRVVRVSLRVDAVRHGDFGSAECCRIWTGTCSTGLGGELSDLDWYL